jgi:two-component system, OmpR family, response regulator PrrA
MAHAEGAAGKVLVVDDDGAFRELVGGILARAGYRVTEAASGEEALETARRGQPDVVLLDVRLPGLSGHEVCRKLRSELDDTLPVLFVSGERVESFDRVAGFLVGGDDYLVKPFAPDELLERIRALVRRASAQSTLTAREREVVNLLREGLGAEEIGDRLGDPPETVRHQIDEIFHKVGV